MIVPTHFFRSLLVLVLLFGAAVVPSTAQRYPSQEVFGKNRVQYRSFDWYVLTSNNFEIYYYQGGLNLANQTAQLAEVEFDRVTEVLGYTPYNRVKIFLYNSPSDLSQSNMGIAAFGDLDDQELDLAKSRIEIAFTGDHMSFRKKLVYEISLLFVYDMLYGGSLRDALQSSLLLSVPEWFMSGIAAYIAEGWTPQMADHMRDYVLRSNKRPNLLTGDDARLVGVSIWHYITERYGKDNISNILNLTRIIRTEQTSITSTLGVGNYGRFLRQWREYYLKVAQEVNAAYKAPEMNWSWQTHTVFTERPTFESRLSSDGKLIAFSDSRKGKYRVQVVDTETGRRQVIRNGSLPASTKPEAVAVPLVAWSRYGQLALLVEENNRVNLYIYENLDTKKPRLRTKRVVKGLDQIVDMDFSDDGTTLALSADKGGQNDLYLLTVARASLLQLTNDVYDDLTPRFVSGSARRVVFVSDRSTDSLSASTTTKGAFLSATTAIANLSLFEHDGNPRATAVQRIPTLSDQVQLAAVRATDEEVYFTSSVKGIVQLFKLERATGRLAQLTNLQNSIYSADLTTRGRGELLVTLYTKGAYTLGLLRGFSTSASYTTPTLGKEGLRTGSSEELVTQQPDESLEKDTTRTAQSTTNLVLKEGEIDTDNYEFDEDVLRTFEFRQRKGLVASVPTLGPKSRRRESISVKGPYNYKGLFFANDATSDWRIDPIRGFGFSQSISMNDLLENHVVKAGGFLSSNFRNNDLFAEYTNYKYRIDFSLRVDRSSLYIDSERALQKYRFSHILLTAAYPLTIYSRVSLSPLFASTRMIDIGLLSEPDRSSSYTGARAEYVFDNTSLNSANMLVGTRLKVRYENYLGLTRAGDSFNRVSLDFRRYQKLYRGLIFATRASFSYSGGSAPKQNVMGGMENWVANRRDNRTEGNPLAFGQGIDNRDIFFTNFATNLRGFDLNRISGTTYMLLNAELRMPLVKFLYRGPVTSNFLRNFQLIAFTDIGTAWTGNGPFSEQSSLNTRIIGGRSEPFRATVTDFRNPYLIGYGVGARTMLFGFYAKFDYAWGVDNSVINKGVAYLTLGYDF